MLLFGMAPFFASRHFISTVAGAFFSRAEVLRCKNGGSSWKVFRELGWKG